MIKPSALQAAYLAGSINVKLKVLHLQKGDEVHYAQVSTSAIGEVVCNPCLRIESAKLRILWLEQSTKGTPAELKTLPRRICWQVLPLQGVEKGTKEQSNRHMPGLHWYTDSAHQACLTLKDLLNRARLPPPACKF